jgi:hypothetical protein
VKEAALQREYDVLPPRQTAWASTELPMLNRSADTVIDVFLFERINSQSLVNICLGGSPAFDVVCINEDSLRRIGV